MDAWSSRPPDPNSTRTAVHARGRRGGRGGQGVQRANEPNNTNQRTRRSRTKQSKNKEQGQRTKRTRSTSKSISRHRGICIRAVALRSGLALTVVPIWSVNVTFREILLGDGLRLIPLQADGCTGRSHRRERSRPFGRLVSATWMFAVACVVVACSSSSGSNTAPTGSPAPSVTVPAGVDRLIRASWATAFGVDRPAAARADVIQGGARFLPWLRGQNHSPTWVGTRAVVSSVALVDAEHATVGYRLVRGNRTIVSAGGAAVLVNGNWLVASSTVCSLSIIRGDRAPGC